MFSWSHLLEEDLPRVECSALSALFSMERKWNIFSGACFHFDQEHHSEAFMRLTVEESKMPLSLRP